MLASGERRHCRLCPLCAMTEATDPINMYPFSPFPIRFTILVLA